ncbi:MAG: bifunctional adenosylcobinamide kinase/adenosylcobinamide-phosphate guanylyltransferase [Candidatus Omnitrophota bacterium]
MAKLVFVLGGARSGKSSYAVELAEKLSRNVAYIATCVHPDPEMKQRIKRHKKSRPGHWQVVEEGRDISAALGNIGRQYNVVIIDCLGLLVTNLLLEHFSDSKILKTLQRTIQGISGHPAAVLVVSNEVGSGIIPDNPLGRRFRDLLGIANQMFARKADEVIWMQAGIPVKIK